MAEVVAKQRLGRGAGGHVERPRECYRRLLRLSVFGVHRRLHLRPGDEWSEQAVQILARPPAQTECPDPTIRPKKIFFWKLPPTACIGLLRALPRTKCITRSADQD